METNVMALLDRPACMDAHGITRCGLPAASHPGSHAITINSNYQRALPPSQSGAARMFMNDCPATTAHGSAA